MRRLLVFRHSKTERLRPGGSDRDRVLTERGRADAARLGLYIARHNLKPNRVLVSPAARTLETWAIVSAALSPPPTTHIDHRIYEASAAALFELAASTPTEAATLMMVGHNPGLHELAALLTASGDIETRERLHEELPTSGLAVIEFAFDDWSLLHSQAGRLVRFVTPDALESASS